VSNNFREIANFIWSIRDLIRDEYKRNKHGEIILPFTVLRRIDCVLEPTKSKVLSKHDEYKSKLEDLSGVLKKASGHSFYNTSKYDFKKLLDEASNIKENLIDYINGFSDNIGEIIKRFKLREKINDLAEKDLLYQLIERFAEIDLHPNSITNHEMGYIFEELIRKSNESSNETAGEHFTPREIIRLMVNILMSKDKEELSKKAKIVTVYDPACGSGGMLTIAKKHIKTELNPNATVELFGQEVNDETFALCKSDMLIKGEKSENIKYGSSFSKDGLKDKSFDYIISNPPYGKDWKKDKTFVDDEYDRGTAGRFSAGLPRINDGQLLFLQHMISKMHPLETGERTRIAIVFNSSPLTTGEAGSGESEIRRWIIENDFLEAIIALPNQLFYNTDIFTYIWVLTNKKERDRQEKITLIEAKSMFKKMRKSLGKKRQEINDEQILEITREYFNNRDHGKVKVFDTKDFGYRKITIERPLKLNFQASEERIEMLKTETPFAELAVSKKKKDIALKKKEEESGKLKQAAITKVLLDMDDVVYQDYDEFCNILDNSFKLANIKIEPAMKKSIINSLSERDKDANVVLDSKGNPQPDVELRDYEKVPLKEGIDQYFKREVLPYAPDAWISKDKKYFDKKDNKLGKIGYEINFIKQFYKYIPPRPLEIIDNDLTENQKEILDLLEEVTK
tara:strand:+ start:187 stop:2229 length:2043 start_codon:yes stop_codon:yes gene_type:complete